MIKLTATATIRSISPVIEIAPKNGGQPFYRRELILDDTWTKDGNTYPNYVLIEFTGDKMAMLDYYTPGQRVTVEAFINGREYQGKVFNSIKGLSIAPYQAQAATTNVPQQSTYPQAPGGYPQAAYPPQGGYPQQPANQQATYPNQAAYPSQGGYAQPPGSATMPGTPQGNNLGPEGLPFLR